MIFLFFSPYKPWYSSSLFTWSKRQHGQQIAAKASVRIEPYWTGKSFKKNWEKIALLVNEILYEFLFEEILMNQANNKKMVYRSIHQLDWILDNKNMDNKHMHKNLSHPKKMKEFNSMSRTYMNQYHYNIHIYLRAIHLQNPKFFLLIFLMLVVLDWNFEKKSSISIDFLIVFTY